MTTERKFYRTVFEVEVLSEEPYPYDSLEIVDVAHDITTGDCNGNVTVRTGNQQIDGQEAARRLIASGSDPGFFQLTKDGEDDA